MLPRIISGLIGAFFAAQALNWLLAPADAAKALGMPLLDGIGRSTQIGDISGLFFALGALGALGAIQSNPHWPRAAALILGTIAITRAIAWALHDAAFASVFIAVEAICAGALLFAASRFEATGQDISS